jgi:hypothetical protein
LISTTASLLSGAGIAIDAVEFLNLGGIGLIARSALVFHIDGCCGGCRWRQDLANSDLANSDLADGDYAGAADCQPEHVTPKKFSLAMILH